MVYFCSGALITSANINGPVYWLATGAVDVEGTVDIAGQDGLAISMILDSRRRSTAGPGGYAGGVGGKFDGLGTAAEPLAQQGDGPGGGTPGTGLPFASGCPSVVIAPGIGGAYSGNAYLVPLVGGSGGGGGLRYGTPLGSTAYGASGGAGGGALLIASSGVVTINGTINANGGAGGNGDGSPGYCDAGGFAIGWGGGGSGGGIRIAANTFAGNGTLNAFGGTSTNCNGRCPKSFGSNGVIRIEAFTDSFSGTFNGTQTSGSPFATFVPTNQPTITVSSVSGTNLPQSPTGNLATPDVTINTTSGVTLTVNATYIPVGTVITLHVFSDNNTDQTIQTTPLAGTLQSSQATATVTFPSGYSLNYVKATWTATN